MVSVRTLKGSYLITVFEIILGGKFLKQLSGRKRVINMGLYGKEKKNSNSTLFEHVCHNIHIFCVLVFIGYISFLEGEGTWTKELAASLE